MNKVKLPPQVCGKWIWLSDCTRNDSFLFFRTEVNVAQIVSDADFWVSASTAYQLFINDHLVAFGPEGHHRQDSCYIDQHHVGYYIEPGINVIAVKVHYRKIDPADDRPPGFWCQLAIGNDIVCSSDENWLVMPADFCSAGRPEISPGGGLTQISHAGAFPDGWTSAGFKIDARWKAPDQLRTVDEFPLRPELYPLVPPAVAPESPDFVCCGGGKIERYPLWTGVRFKNVSKRRHETFAAVGYVFSEERRLRRVELFSDVPFKLYCGIRTAAGADSANGLTAELVLEPGWNKILLFQTPGESSMGFMMTWDNDEVGKNFVVMQDMIDSAAEGWCTAGPLRLKLKDATPSLCFDRLRAENSVCRFNTAPCVEALLARSCRTADTNIGETLTDGTYKTWKMPRVGYGFVSVSVNAAADDVVDISISPDCPPDLFAGNGEKRCINTLVCRHGKSTFLQFFPADCVYVTVFCRHSRSGVRVESVQFRELRKDIFRLAAFRCSDDFLNRLWETGCNTFFRAGGIVATAESREKQDVFLFDAYADSVNAAVICGDTVYLAAGLRRFLESQLENGAISAITHCGRSRQQVFHMLFLPQWILHNFSFSGSLAELEKSLPALDAVRDFFESMLDPDEKMLDLPDEWQKADNGFYPIDPESEAFFCCVNSLFCRFLLSAVDVYRIPEKRKGDVSHCLRLAEHIACKLRESCLDAQTGLFSSARKQSDPVADCFSNFCALYGGVMTPESFENFFFEYFNYDPPFDKYSSMTAYFNFLFTEMMFACGQRRWVYRYMLDYWQKRLDHERGGWLRNDGKCLVETAFSDGGMISPNVFLAREVLGIRHCGTGQQILYFHPGVDFVEKAEGSVPLCSGRLLVKWQRSEDGGLDVTLECNTPVTIMPELSIEHLKKTSFALSEEITLIKPPEDFEDDLDF